MYIRYQSSMSVRYAVRHMAATAEVKHGLSIASTCTALKGDARARPWRQVICDGHLYAQTLGGCVIFVVCERGVSSASVAAVLCLYGCMRARERLCGDVYVSRAAKLVEINFVLVHWAWVRVCCAFE